MDLVRIQVINIVEDVDPTGQEAECRERGQVLQAEPVLKEPSGKDKRGEDKEILEPLLYPQEVCLAVKILQGPPFCLMSNRVGKRLLRGFSSVLPNNQ